MSGISRQTLLQYLQEYALIGTDQAQRLSEGTPSITELRDQLLSDNILTRFQFSALETGELNSLIVGKYLIIEQLGKGGMGVVYLARDRRLKRNVALKILPPKLVSDRDAFYRFRRETEVLARLQHPNVAMAFDGDEDRGIHYLVMEYIEGCNLSQKIRRDGPLQIDEAIEIVKQAAMGLDYIHRNGVIHRDVKPANMIVNREGNLKILDVGLAKIIEKQVVDDEITTLDLSTENEIMMGTMAYMAPEQALDSRRADERSDIYSLGCSLYFLLTGQTVFSQGSNSVINLVSHSTEPPPKLTEVRPDCPQSLAGLFQKMLNKEPAERYQTMSEVIEVCQYIQRTRHESPPTLHWATSLDPNGSATTTRMVNPAENLRRKRFSVGIWGGLTLLTGSIGLFFYFANFDSNNQTQPVSSPEIANQSWELVTEFPTDTEQISWIEGIAFGQDGQSVLVAGGRHDDRPRAEFPLLMHSLPDGVPKRVNREVTSWTRVGEISPDHRFFAVGTGGNFDQDQQVFQGGDDAAVFVWDLSTLELVSAHRAHTQAVRALAFLPDSKQFLSAGPDGSLYRWTVGVDNEPRFYNNRGQILSLAVSPDGSMMAVGHWEDVTIRETESGAELFQYPVSKAIEMRFSPDGDHLAIADDHHDITVLQVASKTVLARFTEHTERINCLHWFGESPYLISASEDETLKIWDLGNRILAKSLHSPAGGFKCLAYSPRSSQIAAGTDRGMVLVWNHPLR